MLCAIYSRFDFPAPLLIFTDSLHQKAATGKAAGEQKNLSGFCDSPPAPVRVSAGGRLNKRAGIEGKAGAELAGVLGGD